MFALADRSFLFKEPASAREFMVVLLLQLAELSFVSQPSILLPDSHLTLCVLCAHNQPNSSIHLDWLCVCSCGRETGGVKQRRGKWSVPQSHRSPHHHPPGAVNHYQIHTYTVFVRGLNSSLHYPCLLYYLWNVLFWKTQLQNIALRISPRIRNVNPVLAAAH